MRTALLATFDLLVNAIGSFWVAALVVALAARALRLGPGRAARALWCFPFLKVLWDAARGIPADAFFWARIEGTRQELGSFMLGAGLHYVVPSLRLALASHTDRGRMPSTVADLLGGLLSRRVSPLVPALIALLVLAVALARMARRAARLVDGERELERLRAGATRLADRAVRGRAVEVFVSAAHRGAPYTGGLRRPYVCFPEATWAALSPGEREAAIAHEVAHVARRDLLLATALDLASDLLWFVPFVGAVRRRIDESTEHLADAHAVEGGVPPLDLASALVRAGEAISGMPAGRAPALIRRESELARRVAALLGRAPAPRLGLRRPVLAALATAWVLAVALSSSLAGHF